ncbi:MAG TPA: hypothetical protein VGP70_13100 [Actinomadura sp.]|jgi:hypothetical protein|nr:hypothetical protein [Actinomadura sp.]
MPAQDGWEGALFDGSADAEPGDSRYAPVTFPGAGTPPKPGTPSSGNIRIPEWMREEDGRASAPETGFDDQPGRGSRVVLFAGVGLLVIAMLVAAAVYFLMSGDGAADTSGSADAASQPTRAASEAAPPPGLPMPADKLLRRFPGTPSKTAGQMTDAQAGLVYPRFGAPWQLPTRANRLSQLGWSGQQAVVTERRGPQVWYGQLLSGSLSPAEMSGYGGPGTEQAAAVAFARSVEARLYGFQHKSLPFASQPLMVDGHKGWLVSSYLRYQRPGVRATGELTVAAVIDTGRKSPAVLYLAVPNTHRRLWSDITYFLENLHVAP